MIACEPALKFRIAARIDDGDRRAEYAHSRSSSIDRGPVSDRVDTLGKAGEDRESALRETARQLRCERLARRRWMPRTYDRNGSQLQQVWMSLAVQHLDRRGGVPQSCGVRPRPVHEEVEVSDPRIAREREGHHCVLIRVHSR